MHFKIAFLCVCALAIIQTKAFLKPRSSQEMHKIMTMPELGFYFGTVNQHEVSDYQIIYMPVLMPKLAQNSIDDEEDIYEDDPIDYGFNVFGREVNLKLKPNRNLMSPGFKIHRWNTPEGDPEIITFADNSDCHYLHKGDESVAAISMCQDQIIHGLIFLDNTTYEIRPLTERLRSYVKLEEALLEEVKEEDKGVPHIVRRATLQPLQMFDDLSDEQIIEPEYFETEENEIFIDKRQSKASGYIVELAMFFDEAAYKLFAPYLNYNEKEMRDMLLAYMNGVQALYHHPSLGTSIELTLVRLDLMKSQPANMPHYNGERSKLLDSFCAYQKSLNPTSDSNPNHWDMALYISGLDFYAIEGGTRSGVTMGLATVGGVCYDQYACVIAELGTTNVFGRPYPSAGFTSVYILAHEIGHNLGMHHDSSGNSCPKEGYIMSPSRGTNGETIWSSCSANVMRNLGDKPGPIAPEHNHGRYEDTPGQAWGAKRQCEILLKDKDAQVSTAGSSLTNICQQLQCKTPHRSGFYYAGPALEGTDCGKNMWCQGGICTKRYKKKPSIVQGGWSDWTYGKCNSGCIVKGKGFLTKQRICDNPKPVNTEEGCEGSSYEVNICNDDKVCGRRRRSTIVEYASKKCQEFSKRLPELDRRGAGLQAPHEESRLWMSCAIFCRRADTGSYYTPRIDLNDLGVDPYFPDGTWCNYDGKENYYCLQHHCLPETFKFTKLWGTLGEDLQLLGNARPHPVTLPPIIQKYLSLGEDGKPLLTSIGPEQNLHPPDDDWTNHDYMDLPESFNKRQFMKIQRILYFK